MKDNINVSEKNCRRSTFLLAPNAFFTPISLNLFSAIAVERLVKLIAAMRIISTAMIEKSLTFLMGPPPHIQ